MIKSSDLTFDAILCTLSFKNAVSFILAHYRNPGANAEEDDSRLIRALNFVSQLEPECLIIGDFERPILIGID